MCWRFIWIKFTVTAVMPVSVTWGLLDSAVAMPKAGFGGEYLHADVFEMAAAHVFHIAKNHPFVDGNKRTSAVAACMFLEMNSVTRPNTDINLLNFQRHPFDFALH
jgi:prophage maintenance system killer protein